MGAAMNQLHENETKESLIVLYLAELERSRMLQLKLDNLTKYAESLEVTRDLSDNES